MNNLDIDTILISSVVILIIVVIAHILILRYKMAHAKLPANIREVGGKNQPAAVSASSKTVKQPKIAVVDETQDNESHLESAKPVETTMPVPSSQPVSSEENASTDTSDSSFFDEPPVMSMEEKIRIAEEAEAKNGAESKIKAEPDNSEESLIKLKPPVVESEEKEEPQEELDYQLLISDPVSIIKNTNAPERHRIAAMREAAYQKLESAVPELINALNDPDESIALVAAESLGAIGDERAIEPLLEASKKNDDELYKVAEEYLGGALVVTGEPNYSGSPAPDSQDAESAPRNYKEMVVFKVEQLPVEYFQPDGSPIPRKELVLKGLNDNNEQMRQMAAKAAIGIEESDEIVEPLSKALTNTLESEAIRALAAEALGGMGSEKSITALINALKDENVAVRYAAATALSGRSEPRVVEALIGATRDEDKFVRASAAYALGTTGAAVALKALMKSAEDENEVVRFSAVKAISGYSFEDVYKRLSDQKNGLERKSQIIAKIEILSQFKDPRATDILRNYLNDGDSEICYKASMALMGQENPDVIEELINASKRLDQELYRLAKENVAPEVFSEVTKFNSDFNFINNSIDKKEKEEAAKQKAEETQAANGTVPPSRRDAIMNAAESVKARNARRGEAVLNINPEDYSGEVIFNEDDYVPDSRQESNRGFNNEELDDVKKTPDEVVVQLDENDNSRLPAEEGYREETYDNNYAEEVYPEPVEQANYAEIVDEEELPLDQITGLPVEFDRIRKKLLDESPTVRGSAANTLGDYPQSRESIVLLRCALKDKNELVRAASVKALGRIANMDALKLILTCERDMSTEVRYAVVKALAEIPDYSAEEALKRMANGDISIDVKRNARLALEKHH